MRVGVEEAVAEDHRHPRLGDPVREVAPLVERHRGEVEVGELDSVDPFEREHARAGVRPVDLRDADVLGVGEVAVELLRVAALQVVVELFADRARELVHELARVDEVERPDPLAGETRGLVEEHDVGLDLASRTRPLHLDGDTPPVRERGGMHLADRRRRDRHRIELGEQPLERVPELGLDHTANVGEWERAHVVLEGAKLDDDVRRDDVGASGEQLPELHERRPELVEHVPQVLAAGRGPSLRGGDAREAFLRGTPR